jgi:hypothetical protein
MLNFLWWANCGKVERRKETSRCRGPSFRSFTVRPLLPTFGLGSFNSTDLPLFLSLSNVAMLSRAFWRSPALQALPKRQVYGLARRTVTTDAASSHAEKEDVPAVSIGQLKENVFILIFCRRMISPSKSSFLMRASKPTNSTLPRIL